MSYEKMKNLTFSKDFRSFKTTHASNNVSPLHYYMTEVKAKEEESTHNFVKDVLRLVIEGSYQLNNKNNIIDFSISQILKEYTKESNRSLWISEYDFDFNYEKKAFNTPEDEKAFNAAMKEKEKIHNDLTIKFINGYYKKMFSAAKKEKYILTNGYNYVKTSSQRSFKYSSDKSIAKLFNGIQFSEMQNYFAIKNYGYHFERLQA